MEPVVRMDEARGREALARGAWSEARRLLEAALARGETASTVEGLSEALWWLDEVERSFALRARAYVLYREAGEACRAVRAALWLARNYIGDFGNPTAAHGWLQRAERLVGEAGDCVERGWLEQLKAKLSLEAAAVAEHAERALAIARRHGDGDLEVWALSEQGRALVLLGRVPDGMAMLDEAVAAATAGEARSLMVVGDTCCNMVTACDRAADFARVLQWCEVVDDFARRHHCLPIFHYCRAVHAGVLIASGRWGEAEKELASALHTVERNHPAQSVHSRSRLALLRVRQGRLEEATELLAGVEDHRVAAEAMACLRLARAEPALAAATIERRLEAGGRQDLVAVPLLGLLVQSRLALGDLEAAASAASSLARIAERSGRPPLQAAAILASARVALGRGASPSAPPSAAPGAALEKAASLFDELAMPFDAAVARLECARARASSDAGRANAEARQALAAFDRLGARLHADQAAALLRELGAGSRPGPRLAGELTRREDEVLRLLGHGLSNLEIGQRLLISPKTVEHHVGRILSKTGLRRRAAAVSWSLRRPAPTT